MAGEFPHLAKKSEGCQITSPETPSYNCIAWAAGETTRHWWPTNYSYWPRGAPREVTLDAFVKAFETLGYERCGDGEVHVDYQKIVLYALDGEPTHAARQLSDGRWTSKLGRLHDVTHNSVRGVEDGPYGKAKQFMRRRTPQARLPQPAPLEAGDGHDADDGPAPVD